MSKSLTVVSTGAGAALAAFATTLISKATKNAVSAKQAASAANNAVVVGDETPAGVHTSVVKASGSGIYAGVATTIVRAVLPRKVGEDVPLRDAVDVLRDAGSEAAAAASFKKSALVAVEAAKASGQKKVVVMLKQQAAYEQINKIFTAVATEVLEGAGIAAEVVATPAVANTLVMFPESVPIVFTNDTPAAEIIEKAFSGLVGSPATFVTEAEARIYGGHSATTVASAVASALKEAGFAAEAAAVEKVAATAKSEKDILAAF